MQKPIKKVSFFIFIKFLFNPLYFLKYKGLNNEGIYKIKIFTYNAIVIQNFKITSHILNHNYSNYVKENKYRLVKLILGESVFTSDGDYWKKQRKKLQPIFHQRSIENMFSIIKIEANEQIMKFINHDHLNLTREFSSLTFNIVGKAIIGTDNSTEIIDNIKKNIDIAAPYGNILLKLPTDNYPKWLFSSFIFKKFTNAINETNILIENSIKNKQINYENIDLLSLLIISSEDIENDVVSIRNEIKTMFLVGSETTQLVLSWLFYFLDKNTVVKNKLINIINEIIPSYEDISINNLKLIKYLDQIIYETMRMCPPAFATGRKSINCDLIDDFMIPANTNIIINFYGLHNDEKFWKNPEIFNPDRFDNIEMHELPFMPFGYGPRFCLGSAFSILEMKIIVVIFLSRYDFKITNRRIYPKPMFTFSPNENIQIQISKLNNKFNS
jgi:cytochrome P450